MTDQPSTADERAVDALTKILESSISPEMTEAQQIILRRLALSGDLFPSRIPPPLNISQVGGYLNLVADDPVLSAQVLAAALGVAGPNPSPGFDPTLPPLYFTTRTNDRPTGVAPATPVQLRVRNDFAGPLDAALASVHAVGAVLPVLATDAPLPPVNLGQAAPTDLLPYLGRTLRLVPSAGLVAPATDPLAVGKRGGAGPQLVVARQLDPTAPDAGTITSDAWSLWTCDATTCTQGTVTGVFLEVGPVLEAAGWHQATPLTAPVSTADDKGWNRYDNLTGLVAGQSTVGEELRLLYSLGQIAASSMRERQDWVWNGTAFAAPV
jgi:hypothetical protein